MLLPLLPRQSHVARSERSVRLRFYVAEILARCRCSGELRSTGCEGADRLRQPASAVGHELHGPLAGGERRQASEAAVTSSSAMLVATAGGVREAGDGGSCAPGRAGAAQATAQAPSRWCGPRLVSRRRFEASPVRWTQVIAAPVLWELQEWARHAVVSPMNTRRRRSSLSSKGSGRSLRSPRNIGVHEMTLGKRGKKAREAGAAATPPDAPLSESERMELIWLRAELREKNAESSRRGKVARSQPGPR